MEHLVPESRKRVTPAAFLVFAIVLQQGLGEVGDDHLAEERT